MMSGVEEIHTVRGVAVSKPAPILIAAYRSSGHPPIAASNPLVEPVTSSKQYYGATIGHAYMLILTGRNMLILTGRKECRIPSYQSFNDDNGG